MTPEARIARVEALSAWVAEVDAATRSATKGRYGVYGREPGHIGHGHPLYLADCAGLAEPGEAAAEVVDIVIAACGLKMPALPEEPGQEEGATPTSGEAPED